MKKKNSYKIGFRLDLKAFDSKNFLDTYMGLFNTLELKVSREAIGTNQLFEIINSIAPNGYSMHLPKDLLERSESEIMEIIEEITRFPFELETNMITHMAINIGEGKSIELLCDVSSELPNNVRLLIENTDGSREQLQMITNILKSLKSRSISNIGFCLDIGHLLFNDGKGRLHRGLDSIFMDFGELLESVYEIHIHDYDRSDHLQLGEGKINLKKVCRFITRRCNNVPIIIESTVEQGNVDGVHQVDLLKYYLREAET